MAAHWRAWGRHLVVGTLAAAITWVAFGADRPVPLLDWFDLGVHEAGHLVTALLPDTVMFLSGSVAQVGFPLAMAAYFLLRRHERSAAGFCLAWAGTSARDVSVYIADAPSQALPLIGGGTHDWAYLLGPNGFGAMDRAGSIADSVAVSGLTIAVVGLGLCLYPLVVRAASRQQQRPLRRPDPVPAVKAALPPPDASGDPWLAAAAGPSQDPGSG